MAKIKTTERLVKNIDFEYINIQTYIGGVFEVFPRKDTAAEESIVFENLSITESMFAESIFGVLSIFDTSYILDQLNLSALDYIEFKFNGIAKIHKYKILEVSNVSDLASKQVHGPAGSVNKIIINFASDEYVFKNFSTSLDQNFIGKISGVSGGSVTKVVPNGFNAEDYDSAEKEMTADNKGLGFVQLIMDNKHQTSWSKKPLEADGTYNDVWIKPEAFLYPYNKTSNNLRVSQIMNYLCEYACYVDNKNAVNFFFWEDLDKWNFKCIESLVGLSANNIGVYNLSGVKGSNERLNDTILSMEVISDISPIKLFDSGSMWSQYIRVVPDWSNPYRGFIDTSSCLIKQEIQYNYAKDRKSIKSIAPYPPVSDKVLEEIKNLKEYSTTRMSDFNYGFYEFPYNSIKTPWWNYQDFYVNLYSELGISGSSESAGSTAGLKQITEKDKRNLFDVVKHAKEPARLETEYWQSQFDFSELPGAFLNRIYKKIKWPLTEARWNYAEAKKLKTKWGVYKNIICCDSMSGSAPSDFFALIYKADKIYGGDGNTFQGSRNGITYINEPGVTYVNDPSGIYAYWWKEVEFWPRAEIADILSTSSEILEFESGKTAGHPFPFVFVSSPTSLQGGYTASDVFIKGATVGYTGPDNRAYNLSEILNTGIPKEFESSNSYTTITMNPGVSSPLKIDSEQRKSFTSYPNKYQMMPIGKFRVVDDVCPEFSNNGTVIPFANNQNNTSGMYYGGRIVQMKVISSDNLTFMRGFTADQKFPLKKQRPFIFMFDADNTHDGLCTGDCA